MCFSRLVGFAEVVRFSAFSIHEHCTIQGNERYREGTWCVTLWAYQEKIPAENVRCSQVQLFSD